jgi:tetratricopeptide (TPR) repeat protein
MGAFRRSPQYVLVLGSSVLALLCAGSSPAIATHGGGHGGHTGGGTGFSMTGGHGGYSNFSGYGAVGGYYGAVGGYYGYGAVGPYLYSPSLMGIAPGGFAPFLAPAFPQGFAPFPMGGGFDGGLNLPMPPGGGLNPAPLPRPRAANPARSKELTEIGDRSFRGRNIKRAEDKYKLAIKADPTSPTPHIHLAQVSVARGNYAAAADHLRDAVTVATDPAWLANAPDIQAIFGEPGDFARQLARLETHLQANPNDRDAWFVLGAETYLSGRTRQAFDVFQRLTDRRLDDAMSAFLEASRPPANN